MTSTLVLPRPVRLSLWANAWSEGLVSLDEAADAARGDDPPAVVGSPEGAEPLITAFRRLFADEVCLAVLPTAGFLLGLAGPAEFNKAAVEAGGAVISGSTGLIPVPTPDHVVWQEYVVTPSHHAETLREASFALRQALTEAAEALATADLPAAREALLDGLVAAEKAPPLLLPRTFSESDEAALVTALRCLRLAQAALDDHAADHSASAARLRTTVLRALDQAARRVLVAASAHRPRR